MRRFAFFFLGILTLGTMQMVHAQAFRVQLTAYNERQPESYFKEKGIEHYLEAVDKSGIYWYSAGVYATREEAEIVHQDVLTKGFPNAFIIDEEEQQVLSGLDCPYIRDGVIFVKAAYADPLKHTIYFEEGRYSLTPEAKAILDEVYQKLKASPTMTLKIKGFTDGLGDGRVNLKLAASRSRSARDYLIYQGVRADRMFMEVFGEAEPAAPNAEDDGSNSGKGRDLPENRKWNRRVTLILEDPAKTPQVPNAPK